MRFLFSGCSYTFGDELLNPINSRFSKLICDHFKAEEINLAKNAYANDNIVMSAVEFLEKDKNIDFVLIQISGIYRITVPNLDKSKIDRKPYIFLNPLDGRKTSQALIARLLINGINTEQNHLWYKLSRYKIVLLDNYLRGLNIPYLFCAMQNEINYFKDDKELPKSFTDNFISESLFEIARENNFSFGKNGHPLEEAHAFYASDIFIPEIEKRI